MTRGIVLGLVMTVGALSMAAVAYQGQPQAAKVVNLEKVKDNLYVVTSSSPADRATFSGGNVAVFITGKGIVLVDTKMAGWGQALLDRIKTVSDKPVTTIINTHTHADHTGNNDLFGTAVEIVAHENTKANMARMDAFKGDKASFLPKRTYTDKMSLGSGADRVDLYYFGAGHTNGDTWVVFPALRVMHAGDMFAWKDAPFLDRNNGGSGVAFPQTLARALAGVKDVDTIIPGHSSLMTRQDLEEYQRYNRDLLAATQEAMNAGKSAADAVATIVTLTTKYKGYKAERVKAAVEAIYDELKK